MGVERVGPVSDVGGSFVALFQVQTVWATAGRTSDGCNTAQKQRWRTPVVQNLLATTHREQGEVKWPYFPLLNPSLQTQGIVAAVWVRIHLVWHWWLRFQEAIEISSWLNTQNTMDARMLTWETKCVKKSSFPPFLGKFWCWEESNHPSSIWSHQWDILKPPSCSLQFTSPRHSSWQVRWWQ